MRIFRLVVRKLWESARKFLPGLIVMFIVFLLMRGVSGTIEAMKLQLATFVTSLLGQGDGLSEVVVQTLPLAIAAGVVAFAIRAKLLTFDSPWSFVGIASIILLGASIGGFLSGVIEGSPKVPGSSALVVVNDAPVKAIGITTDNKHLKSVGEQRPDGGGFFDAQRVARHTLSDLQNAPGIESDVAESPYTQLAEADWLAIPAQDRKPRGAIPPLNFFPESNGVLGVMAKALNQMLGYFVAYQPRMFLAALVAGGWIGWSVQRKLEQIHEQIVDTEVEKPEEFPRASAA